MFGLVPLLSALAWLPGCNGDDDNAAPQVTITTPASGEDVLEAVAVTLSGSATDDADSGADLQGQWTAGDRDLCSPTTAGDGDTFSCDAVLAEGEDTLTLTVTDSLGVSGSASVTVNLVITAEPVAEILAPVDGTTTYANTLIDLIGQVSDAEDAAEDLTTSWTSSLDGELIGLGGVPTADGSIEDTSVLTEGEHTLTLTVEDSTGKQGADSVTLTVLEDNTAPTCAITSPEDNATGQEGDSVTFVGELADEQSLPEALAVVWESDIDGVLATGTGDAEGETSVTTSTLSLGTHAVTLTVADDSGASWASCTDQVLYTVGDPPVIVLTAPSDGDRFDEGVEVTFAATVSDTTDDPGRLDLSWSSDLDGVLDTSSASAGGEAGFSTTELSAGDHTVTLRATDSDDLYAEVSVALTVNGLPTAPVVTIQPDPAATTDGLLAVIDSESVDPEGDAVTYTWTWTVDGGLFAGSITDTITSSDTSRGEVWAVEVTPWDSTSAGPAGTASISIDNTPPVIATVSLTPDPAYEGDTFSCDPETATDADGDIATYQTAWTVDGSTLSTSSSSLDDSWWVKGQEVICTVTPWDTMDAGTPVASNAVVVSNSLPTLDAVAIAPEDPAIDDTLTCSWSGFGDADGDADASSLSWTIDGVEVGTDADLFGAFAPGDTVSCTVTPDDGEDAGVALSASVVVENTPPELDGVSLGPDPAYEGDTLTCTPGTSTDVDGHTVTLTTAWSVSGSESGVTDSSLDSSFFDRDDVVTCSVTPHDGTDAGATVTSSELTISNTPPVLADVALGPDPASTGDTLTCTPGSTTDADADTVSLTFAWTVDGSTASETGDTLDDSHWTRHQDVICTVTPSDGTDDGTPIASNTLTISNSAPSVDSATITPSDPEVDDTLTCSYSGYADADGDADQSTFAWTIGSSTVGTASTLSGAFSAGDLVTCTVTPYDGADTGTGVSDTVIAANTPPEIADAALTPATAYEGDTFTCTPGATSDADGHTVTTSVSWDVSGADPGVTGTSLDSAYFGRDDVVTCTVTPNDGGDDGDSVDSNSVTVSNTSPVIASVSLDPDPAAEGDTLTCSPDSATDADGDSTTTTLAWTVNGGAESHSASTLDDTHWGRGDEVACTATPDDGTDSGSAVSSNTVTIANATPSISSVSISPSDPQLGDTLTCSASGYEDADGDSDQSTWEWTISGTTVGTAETLSSGFASGDLVTCTVTPFDGSDSGTALSATVAVDNTAPVLDSVVLSPDPATTTDTLTCTPGTATDADGHSITYAVVWLIDGSDVGETGTTLDSAWFTRDQTVSCVVTPSDSADEGVAVMSNAVVISNTAPVISSVSLGPDPAVEGDTLQCTVDASSDDDGDAVSNSYAWTVDGSSAGGSGDTLGTEDFARDQDVICTATPSDDRDSGTAVSSATLTIDNSAPSITGVTITPSDDPGVDETLTCTADGFADPDGDSDQSSFSWTLSGTEVGTDSTLSGVFAAADTVTCTVTPSDGTDEGTAASASVQIANSAPVLDSASLTPLTAFEGDTFTCTPGTATDADGHSITYTYDWGVSGSNPGVTTAELGPSSFAAGDVVECLVTPNDGTDDGETIASNQVTVGNTAPVLDSVALTPDPAYVASTLDCTPGTVTDEDGDSVSYRYGWVVNGSDIGHSDASLDPGGVVTGDSVVCQATPYDVAGDGLTVDSNTVTIDNTAPEITVVSISPTSPFRDDTLTCSWSGFSDDDGDSDVSTVSWTLSGTEVGTDTTLSAVFSRDDSVTCNVTPDDGTDTGTVMSASVTIENTPPAVDSASLTPTSAAEGDTLTCTAGSTSDADGDTVTVGFDWLINNVHQGINDSELGSEHWGRGDDVACEVVPNDGTDEGTRVQSNIVTIDNTAPDLTTVTLEPDPAFEGDTLDCVPQDGIDVDGDGISYTYAWTVAGLPAPSTQSSLGSEDFAKGDTVTCTATPDDGTDTGAAVDSNSLTIENSPPTVQDVSIDKVFPTVDDTLTCTWSGYADADGDSDQSTLEWTVNGSSVGTGSTLSGAFVKDDSVTCTVTPYDGEDTGSTLSDTVAVVNGAPLLADVSMTPTTAYEGDTFTCTPGASSDADGDTVTFDYAWSVGGSNTGTTADTLDSTYWGRADSVACTVTPRDGTSAGPAVASNTVTISNTAPEVSSVSLSPSSPTTNETVTASVTTTDVDGDTVSVSYAWTVDGSTVSYTGSGLQGSSYFDKGQQIAVEVVPFDQDDSGTSASSAAVTVVNSPPGVPELEIWPNPIEAGADDVVCEVTLDSADGDVDPITYTFSWELGGAVYPDDFPSAVGPTTTTWTDDTVPAADITGPTDILCTAVPNDGEDDGVAGEAVAEAIEFVNYGNDAAFGSTTILPAHQVRGSTVELVDDTTVHRIGLVTPASSGQVKLALYTDGGGGPNILAVEIPATSLASGTLEVDAGAHFLTAGTYWLVAIYDQDTDAYVDTGTSKTVAYKSMSFSQNFDPTFGSYSTLVSEDYNYYLVVEEPVP